MKLYNGINTEDLKDLKNLSRLKQIYSNIPETECLNCPGKKTIEADCCKSFCPPMFYSEFASIVREMEKKKIFEDKKKFKDILWNCVELYLNPEYKINCIFEKNNSCSIYDQRPFACRMFGLYSKDEWSKRLEYVKEQFGVEKEKIPFYKQCKNIKCIGKRKSISQKESDELFQKIAMLDLEMTREKRYQTFYVFFLTEFLDRSVIKTLSLIKEHGVSNFDKFNQNKISKEEYEEQQNKINEFISKLKEYVYAE